MSRFKYLSMALASLGILFKGNHWVGGDLLSVLGFGSFAVYCLIMVFSAKE